MCCILSGNKWVQNIIYRDILNQLWLSFLCLKYLILSKHILFNIHSNFIAYILFWYRFYVNHMQISVVWDNFTRKQNIFFNPLENRAAGIYFMGMLCIFHSAQEYECACPLGDAITVLSSSHRILCSKMRFQWRKETYHCMTRWNCQSGVWESWVNDGGIGGTHLRRQGLLRKLGTLYIITVCHPDLYCQVIVATYWFSPVNHNYWG